MGRVRIPRQIRDKNIQTLILLVFVTLFSIMNLELYFLSSKYFSVAKAAVAPSPTAVAI
jgi:hypothetical protein